jgi:hypothetical protein
VDKYGRQTEEYIWRAGEPVSQLDKSGRWSDECGRPTEKYSRQARVRIVDRGQEIGVEIQPKIEV